MNTRSPLIEAELIYRRHALSQTLSSTIHSMELELADKLKLDQLMREVEGVVEGVRLKFPDAYITLYLYTSDVTITITQGVPDLITFLIKALGKFKLHKDREPHDNEDGKLRTYHLHREVEMMHETRDEQVQIKCWWKDEATDAGECKLLQTGIKVIEKPIYEMLCEDDPRYAELAEHGWEAREDRIDGEIAEKCLEEMS